MFVNIFRGTKICVPHSVTVWQPWARFYSLNCRLGMFAGFWSFFLDVTSNIDGCVILWLRDVRVCEREWVRVHEQRAQWMSSRVFLWVQCTSVCSCAFHACSYLERPLGLSRHASWPLPNSPFTQPSPLFTPPPTPQLSWFRRPQNLPVYLLGLTSVTHLTSTSNTPSGASRRITGGQWCTGLISSSLRALCLGF